MACYRLWRSESVHWGAVQGRHRVSRQWRWVMPRHLQTDRAWKLCHERQVCWWARAR